MLNNKVLLIYYFFKLIWKIHIIRQTHFLFLFTLELINRYFFAFFNYFRREYKLHLLQRRDSSACRYAQIQNYFDLIDSMQM